MARVARTTTWSSGTACLLPVVILLSIAAGRPLASGPQTTRPGTPPVLPLEVTWTSDLASEPAGPPIATARRVLVALSGDEIVALSPVNGEPIWTTDLQTRWPIATDGTLVFAALASALSAVSAETGARAWRVGLGDLTAPFVARGGWLIAGVAPAQLVALRASDGAEIWRRDVGAPLAAAPAVAGDRVYVALRDGRIVALQIERGETIWAHSIGGAPGGILALEDRVFVGDTDNFLYCLAARDGAVLWRWRTAADVVLPATADDRHIYFVSLDNVLRALDRRTGAQRWRQLLPSRAIGAPQIAGDVVLVAMSVNQLLAFDVNSGARAAIGLTAPLVEPPTEPEVGPEGGRLFVVTVDTSGRARGHALESGRGPAMASFTRLPGRQLWPEIPLATRTLPVALLPLPALPPPGA